MKVNMEQFCDLDGEKKFEDSFIFIIFGGMGDLSKKKLIPAIYRLYELKKIGENFKIILHGRSKRERKDYIEELKKYLKADVCNKFLEKLTYINEDIQNFETEQVLEKVICDEERKLNRKWDLIFYLAVAPELVKPTLEKIKTISYCTTNINKKIILEKPFGENHETAKELNEDLSLVFKENEIYRIDHYLGKETVQNILFFRFGNLIFEPIWSREYIDHIQITIAEDIGIENRGEFYNKNGILKDIIQNHMLQLIGVVAMEYPINFDSDSIRNEKYKVFKSIKEYSEEEIEENIVLGQYEEGEIKKGKVRGYLEEKNIPKESTTPTFFAGKIYVDNWRWSGVPFYLRAGKRMKEKSTEIVVKFKNPPLNLFGNSCNKIVSNEVVFKIQPKEKIEVRINLKYPGDKNYPHPIDLEFDYSKLKEVISLTAYERLILDMFKGDLTLFARQDEIEVMWKIIDPLIKNYEKNRKVIKYKSGENGPKESDELIKKDGKEWMT